MEISEQLLLLHLRISASGGSKRAESRPRLQGGAALKWRLGRELCTRTFGGAALLHLSRSRDVVVAALLT